MSKHINVNPDHYKGAGRERQGEDIVQSEERRVFEQQRALNKRWQAKNLARHARNATPRAIPQPSRERKNRAAAKTSRPSNREDAQREAREREKPSA
jgi:hypothetical protein